MPTGKYPRPTMATRFWRHVQKSGDGCWIWTGATIRGYGRFWTGEKLVQATAASFFLSCGGVWPSPGTHICHTCDNPRCVRPDHLFMGTPAENAADAFAKGRRVRNALPPNPKPGERSNLSKLTNEQVLEIRRLRATGQTIKAIAQAFGMGHSAIEAIIYRKTWKHI